MKKTPQLRVEHAAGYDLLDTSGAMDFDGGSLIVWRDERRNHLVAAYGPGGWLAAYWDTKDGKEADDGPVQIK